MLMKKNEKQDLLHYLLELKSNLEINQKISNFNTEKILMISNSKYSIIRDEIADLAIYFPYEISERLLNQLLEDKKWTVRISALNSLKLVGKNEIILNKLINSFEKEKYVLNKAYIIETISHIVNNGNIYKEKYIQWLIDQRTRFINKYRINHACIYSLTLLNEKTYFSDLIKDLSAKELDKRLSCLVTLRKIMEFEISNDTFYYTKTIIEVVKGMKRMEKKRFPYINYEVDYILNIEKNLQERK